MRTRPHTQSTLAGRVLIALRPGEMTTDEMIERFGLGVTSSLTLLRAEGLIERRSGLGHDTVWLLTAAGREACPCRRDPVTPRYAACPRKSRARRRADPSDSTTRGSLQ